MGLELQEFGGIMNIWNKKEMFDNNFLFKEVI